MISGSTGLTGGVNGAMVLKRDRGKQDATLVVDGRDIEEPAELALRWDAEIASWSLMGDAEEYRQSEERRRIMDLLMQMDDPMYPKDIAEALDKNRSTTRVLLANMKQDGQVEDTGRGYVIGQHHKQAKQHKQTQQDKQRKQVAKSPAVDDAQAVYGVYGVYGDRRDSPRLTEEEADTVKRRIREGMKPERARQEVVNKRGQGGGGAA